MSVKKKFLTVLGVLSMGFIGVFDYTRYIKSVFFDDTFVKTAETDDDKTKNYEINSTLFSEEIFAETSTVLKIIGIGTEKVARTATIDETNPYLRHGNDDNWDTYDQNSFNRQDKYKWPDDTYKNFADGAKSEMKEINKDGTPYALKGACTVWSGGKLGDYLKELPITIYRL